MNTSDRLKLAQEIEARNAQRLKDWKEKENHDNERAGSPRSRGQEGARHEGRGDHEDQR